MTVGIDLSGRTAVVTGGTGGIGTAVSLMLAAAGARVVATHTGIDDKAERLLGQLQTAGGGPHQTRQVDVSDSASVDGLAEELRRDGAHVDILVLVAGIAGAIRPIADTDLGAWQRVLDVDLTGVYLVTRAVLPLMGAGGAVVAIGTSVLGRPGTAAYGAAKAGVDSFIRTLAQEAGPRGIRANVVAPGSTDTAFGGRPKTDEFRAAIAAATALGRIGQPQDVAGAVLFLCSDLAGFLTGQVIHVDGGYM